MLLGVARWSALRGLRRRGIRSTTRAVEVPQGNGKPDLVLALSTLTNEPTGDGGKPLVLLHGLGSSNLTWSRVLPELAAHGTVWAPDWPGFGGSALPPSRQCLSVPELVACAERFVEKVAPGGAVVVGQSMGGWVATRLALRRPDLVSRLVLLNSAGVLTGHIFEQRDLFSPRTRREIRHLWKRMWHRVPALYPLLAREYLKILDSPAVRHFLASVVEEDFLNHDLASLRVPTTVVWGLEDELLGLSSLAHFRKLKDVHVVEVEECGHVPQLEAPKVVLEEVGKAWKGEPLYARSPPAPVKEAAAGVGG